MYPASMKCLFGAGSRGTLVRNPIRRMGAFMKIRKLLPHDFEPWLNLRRRLWPDMTAEDLKAEQEGILFDPRRNRVLVSEDNSGALVGFVEVSLRDWADGCTTHPVGYIEGWYVEPQFRRSGVGRALICAAEQWALEYGCTELGSDAELANELSHRAHAGVGFTEVVRVVLFSKKITATRSS